MAASFLAALLGSSTRGDQTFYVGPNNGLWSTGSNWDAGVQPMHENDAVIGQFVPGRAGDVNVTFDGSYPNLNSALKSLRLDATGTTGAIIINQSSNSSALFALSEFIGVAGRTAQYNQSGGTNTFSDGQFGSGDTISLYLGYDSGSTGQYTLTGGTLASDNVSILWVGYSGSGSFSQNGGSVRVSQLTLANSASSSGTYTLAAGNVEITGFINGGPKEIIGNGNSASFVQTGGTHTVGTIFEGSIGIGDGSSYILSGGTLTVIGQGPPAYLGNEGTFTISGGALILSNVGALDNFGPPLGHGIFNYVGGSISFPQGGTINNSATFNISVAVANLAADFTNTGLVHVTGGSVSFGNTFANNAQYISTAPSRQTFSTLNIGTNGHLQGGAGDVFDVGRNLTNNSTKLMDFDLNKCWLVLSGNGITHRVAWPGADVGPLATGYTNNFAVGVFKLASGNSLTLLDGNGSAGAAIYVEVLQLDGGISQIANIATSGGISIYYDPNNSANSYLQGDTYQLNGGGVIAPVPDRTPPPDPTPSPTPVPTPTPTATPTATPTPTAIPTGTPGILGNISTRLRVLSGDNALIGGLIATGTAGKRVIIRAIGPSLAGLGVPGALTNPTLDLFEGSALLFSNDDWNNSTQQADIAASGLAPINAAESAIIWTLVPGQNYTAVVRGLSSTTGIGVVDAFDLDQAVASKLGNISTRGFVDVDDNVMIAGLIAGPSNGTSLKVLVRALGPTLSDFGVAGALANPTLDLVNSSGTVIRSNNNWKDDPQQRAEIEAAGLAPSHDEEAALVETVAPGAYTAVVRGSTRTTGVGLVEAYNIP